MAKKKKSLKKEKRPSLIEQGYHVYMGTIRVRGKDSDQTPKIKPPVKIINHSNYTQGIVTHELSHGGCGAQSVIQVKKDQIGKPFEFICSGCGKYLKYDRVLPRAADPLSFHLFGDESSAQDIVLYGILALNENDVQEATKDFAHIISLAGMPAGTRFHSKTVFNEIARANTPWQNLSASTMWEIAKDLIVSLKSHRTMFCIGIVDRSSYPNTIPSGKGGTIQVTPEHLYVMAYQAAIATIDNRGLINPQTKLKLWIDPQKTVLDFWGIGRAKIERLLRYKDIEPETINGEKPLLLDAVDLFTYIAGRALSKIASPHKQICEELNKLCDPARGDAGWIPPNQEKSYQWRE
ncbi:MAG: hypothetical protein HY740_04610 [Chloroflexi bacterium]|nr:hypothetical protein [Chloroflexota bacterium]